MHQPQPVTPAGVGVGDPARQVPARGGAVDHTQPRRVRAQAGGGELARVGANRGIGGRKRGERRERANQQQCDECPPDGLAS